MNALRHPYSVATWVVLTVTCYFAAILWWPLALPAAVLALQIEIIIAGLSLGSGNNLRAQSMILMFLLIAASVYFATTATWVRFAAWQFLALIALNAIAGVIIGRIRILILGFAAVAPIALVLLWPHSALAGIGILALSHMLILYPTLRPNVQWLGPVFTHFETGKRELWLTIDDGPNADTPALLDLLDRLGVKATFFIIGIIGERHPDFVREIVARGHSIGNHSQTHPSAWFWCAPPARVRSEIDDCNRTLATLAGVAPRWFRAPVGMKNPFVHPALARRGMRLIGWTARGFDAVMHDADQVLERILPHVKPGAIIVLHQGREHSLRVIERVVGALQERGYSFVIPDDAVLRNTNR
jgi:peptidoglycan/xylan/chitin deacetylase (PgdA/CDA1 family)